MFSRTRKAAAPGMLELYRQMLRCRLFEEAVGELWRAGEISGEMHLGLGEEAIVAAVVGQLRDGDALALDHRPTAALLARGVDPVPMLREFLGREDGLCGGRGGHMHLFSRPHLAASSGIVGASGPAAVGFALSGRSLRPGSVSVAFFGEGAMNQGMLMESLNLAATWKLPVLFVCKDNDWSITTRSSEVRSGDLVERAAAFGLPAERFCGWDLEEAVAAAGAAVHRARAGGGPSFLLGECVHIEGHMLGDPLLRVSRRPVEEMRQLAGPLLRSAAGRGGSSLVRRIGALLSVTATVARSSADDHLSRRDPLVHTRRRLETPHGKDLEALEAEVEEEIRGAVARALETEAHAAGSSPAEETP